VGRYSHVGLYDLAATVNNLPAIGNAPSPSNANVDALRATGTEDAEPPTQEPRKGQISLGPFLGPQPATMSDFLRQAETKDPTCGEVWSRQEPQKKPVFPEVSEPLPKERLELSPPCGDRILRPARLPIPPLRRPYATRTYVDTTAAALGVVTDW